MIETIATSAWANPAYALGALVGLGLGVFYGFDGWRGDTADVEFKDSPRVKNMLWVLGGGFTAFIGDVKALDPTANKALLLLSYFASWFAAVTAVVLLVGLLVAIGQIVASVKRRNHGYGPAEAVSDYFFYGYRHYRAKAEAARENQSTRFHMAYLEQVALTVAAVGSVTAVNRSATVQAILVSIAAVIKSYHRDEGDMKGIRANLMLKRDCDDQLRQRLRFVDAGTRARTTQCLELITYEVQGPQPDIVLPISNDLNTALPGAPIAFLDRSAAIDDTWQIAFAPGVPEQVRTEVNTGRRHQR